MKNVFVATLVVVLMAPALSVLGQSNVFISNEVLKTAEWAGVKYKDEVKRASSGNIKSIEKLFDFHRYVDGVQSLDHAVTLLELIPLAQDRNVATAAHYCNPKLKKVALDRLILAQGRTQKEELRKPLQNWAPLTWAVLNGRALPQPEATAADKTAKEARRGTDAESKPAPKTDGTAIEN
ncbi:MAG: hypothetical protein IT260_17245 [Saprospiraceae bacterium]|nr:hypothetical protein [Saprospiraceae bacterium]